MKKNYIGRINRNGTKVTRATFDNSTSDWHFDMQDRHERRAQRWLKAHPDEPDLVSAPRHIRENVA